MNAYVAPDLSDEEYYALIELSNLRDTSYMGATLPCAAICYSIENKYTGQRTIHYADVIFNSSINKVINVTKLIQRSKENKTTHPRLISHT